MWWRAFKSMLQQQPQDCGLLMTEAPFNLPSIQTSTMQVQDKHSLSSVYGQWPDDLLYWLLSRSLQHDKTVVWLWTLTDWHVVPLT